MVRIDVCQTVQALMSDLEAGVDAEEASQLQIEESQLQEYNKCKQKAGEKTVSLRQELEQLQSQLKSGQVCSFTDCVCSLVVHSYLSFRIDCARRVPISGRVSVGSQEATARLQA